MGQVFCVALLTPVLHDKYTHTIPHRTAAGGGWGCSIEGTRGLYCTSRQRKGGLKCTHTCPPNPLPPPPANFFNINLFIYVFMAFFGLCWDALDSHCGGFSCCRARALGVQASVVMARELSSCGSRAVERRVSSCGTRT